MRPFELFVLPLTDFFGDLAGPIPEAKNSESKREYVAGESAAESAGGFGDGSGDGSGSGAGEGVGDARPTHSVASRTLGNISAWFAEMAEALSRTHRAEAHI